MQAWEITGEGAEPEKALTPAQARVRQLKQQTKQAQQQVKREKATQQLHKARQALAQANVVSEAVTGTHDYSALVSVAGITCRTTINADGYAQARLIAERLFGRANVRSIV